MSVNTLKSNVILFITVCISLCSCLSAKNLDKQVTKQYYEITAPRKNQPNPNIVITSDLISTDSKISNSESKTSQVIPLIIYNEFTYTINCTINPQIPINRFITTVQREANKSVKGKIEGQVLDLKVEKIPNIFEVKDKGYYIFLGLFNWEEVSIMSNNIDLVVNYKLSKNEVEIKKGSITIPYIYDKEKLGMFKNWKTATAEFLDQYDRNITEMSKSFAKKLDAEL